MTNQIEVAQATARTAAVITMLSRAKPGAIVKCHDSALQHTISCAAFARPDLTVISFSQFEKAFLLFRADDIWQIAYPSGKDSESCYASWVSPELSEVNRDSIENQDNLVLVWRFHESPDNIKRSTGGDEDWLALLPTDVDPEVFDWLYNGNFGVCSVEVFDRNEFRSIAIGCHA